MGPQGADVAHPAFAKLFVETEYLAEFGAILATRRKRTPSEPEMWAAHLSVANGEAVGNPAFETDRARFLGRGQGVSAPIAMLDARPLTNSIGAVLDPIFALRRRVRVAAGATVRVAFWTMAAGTREALLDCVDKHRDAAAYERATTLAWTQAQVQLHHLGVNPGEAGLFQRLASHVIFAGRDLRPSSDVIRQGSGPQSGLWSQGISGDLPIVLLRIAEIETLNVARQVLQAHEYWRMKQLAVDLVILNERKSSYVQDLQVAIETLVRASQSRPAPGIDRPAGPGLRSSGGPDRRRHAFAACLDRPRCACGATRKPFRSTRSHRQPDRADTSAQGSPRGSPWATRGAPYAGARILQRAGRICGGRQGICDDTRAWPIDAGALDQRHRQSELRLPDRDRRQRLHLVRQQPRKPTHALVKRSRQRPAGRGLLCARRQRPATSGVRQPLPFATASGVYVARHGRGYSRFEHTAHGIAADLLQYVPVDGSIKISRLRLTNKSNLTRHLSVTAYVEWVLGASRSATLAFVETEIDATTGALFARNPWNAAFGSRVAFADMRGRAERLDRRSARVHRPQSDARESGGARERVAAVQQGRRGLGSLRRDAHQARIAAREAQPKSSSFWDEAANARGRPRR